MSKVAFGSRFSVWFTDVYGRYIYGFQKVFYGDGFIHRITGRGDHLVALQNGNMVDTSAK